MVDKNKFADEDAQGYIINILGRNVQVTEAMKNYAWDKMSKVERFHNHVMHIQITLDIQKLEHYVEIIAKFDHLFVKVEASSTDMYASIDKAIDRLVAQLRRWKGKIQDYHNKKLSAIDMEVNVLRRPYNEIEDFNAAMDAETTRSRMAGLLPPEIIGKETRPLKTLTCDEAVMKIDLSGDDFLIFRDEVDLKLKVIYQRSDGHYGIIQAE
jgi:putative sigma-54 modulation protein